MCGIFAIINNQRDDFDYQSFCTLGVANDRRGGDSCGIFIDGKVEYGIDKRAKFEDFFWGSDLLNSTDHSKIALGHCRKASVGTINLKNAHPIIIEEEVESEEGSESKKEIKFVMVHNGTIHNYEELAKKYIPNIDIKGMTDSQVLARLIYYSGFDFLAEYNGGTAFIAVDYRKDKPEILLWRGESKRFSSSTEVDEERPLFANLENDRLVVSSIHSYLAIVDRNCYIVPANKVLTYHDNKLWIKKEIDRSNAYQTKKYEYHNDTYKSTYVIGQSQYMRFVTSESVYKCGFDKLDGKTRMTTYGRILSKYEAPKMAEIEKTVWFFNGIPLHNEDCYKFICKAIKRTGLKVEEFCKAYQNFIRYFSCDQLYNEDLSIYKAVAPFERKLFTGYKQQLAEASKELVTNGKGSYQTIITSCSASFDILNEKRNYDYKTIWKEFIQSMG